MGQELQGTLDLNDWLIAEKDAQKEELKLAMGEKENVIQELLEEKEHITQKKEHINQELQRALEAVGTKTTETQAHNIVQRQRLYPPTNCNPAIIQDAPKPTTFNQRGAENHFLSPGTTLPVSATLRSSLQVLTRDPTA